jgi:hypothetical protein
MLIDVFIGPDYSSVAHPSCTCSTNQPTVGNEVVWDGLLRFWLIGNEGGFFPSLVGPVSQVLLSPAERYGIIIDFSIVLAGELHRHIGCHNAGIDRRC